MRKPQTGDSVIVDVRMDSGCTTELGGCIEELSAEFAYVALDSLDHIHDPGDDGQVLDRRLWPTDAKKPLRIGVPIGELKPFKGKLDADDPCWVAKL